MRLETMPARPDHEGTLISMMKTEFFSQCYRKLNQLNIFNNSIFSGQFLLHFGISSYNLKQQ